MISENLGKRIKEDSFYQAIAIGLVCIYIAIGIINISMLGWDIAQDIYEGFLPITAGMVFVVRLYLNYKDNKKILLLGIGIFLICYLGIIFLPYDYNKFILPVIIAGSLWKCDYTKVLKAITIVAIFGIVIVIALSRTGAVNNLVYNQNGVIRLSFGFVYPTDFAAFILYMILALIAFNKRVPKYLMAVICFATAILLYKFCRSTCSSMCIGIAGLGCIFYHVYDVFNERLVGTFVLDIINKIIKVVEIGLFGILAITSLVLAALYNAQTMWTTVLNNILHTRLYLGHKALVEYGLSAFGHPDFIQYGYGGTTDSQFEYNFLDCSYVLIAIKFGVVLLILLCIQYVFIIRKAHKAQNWLLAMSLGIIAIHSFMEHHYIEPWYNFFLFIFLCDYKLPQYCSSEKCFFNWRKSFSDRFKSNSLNSPIGIIAIISYVVILALEIYMFPKQSAWIRTVSNVYEWNGEALVQLSTILIIVIGLGWLLINVKLLTSFKTKKKLFFVSEIMGIAVLCIATFVIHNQSLECRYQYADSVEKDIAIISDIYDTCPNANIYVDSTGLYYGEYSSVVNDGFMYDQELALKDNIVYLCDSDCERFVLSEAMFKMVEYEDGRMLYTNSEEVTSALSDKGYEISDKYPLVITLADENNNISLFNNGSNDSNFYVSDKYKLYNTYEINMDIDYNILTDDDISTVLYIYESHPQKEIVLKISADDIIDGKYNNIHYFMTSDDMYIRIEAEEGVECDISHLTLSRY